MPTSGSRTRIRARPAAPSTAGPRVRVIHARAGNSSKVTNSPKPLRPSKVGPMLRAVRKDLGFTQAQMAQMLGVAPRTLGLWELNHQRATKLARAKLSWITQLRAALSEIMDQADIGRWLTAPQKMLGGQSPADVIAQGREGAVWQVIYFVRTGHPD